MELKGLIMKNNDPAITPPNARLLSAVYFGLLAVIATIIIDCVLYSLGVVQIIPFFKAIILAVIIAAIFGAIFGERIVHAHEPYRKHAFFWGFLMVIIGLPFYCVGLVYLLHESRPELFIDTSWGHLLHFYLFILAYSFILAGLWLAIIAGIAAVYLRSYLVYHLFTALYKRRYPIGKDKPNGNS